MLRSSLDSPLQKSDRLVSRCADEIFKLFQSGELVESHDYSQLTYSQCVNDALGSEQAFMPFKQ